MLTHPLTPAPHSCSRLTYNNAKHTHIHTGRRKYQGDKKERHGERKQERKKSKAEPGKFSLDTASKSNVKRASEVLISIVPVARRHFCVYPAPIKRGRAF